MAPTEILAQQHYNLAKKVLSDNVRIEILTSKTENKIRKKIITNLENISYKSNKYGIKQKFI